MKKTFLFLLVCGLYGSVYSQWCAIEGNEPKNLPYYLCHSFTQDEWDASNFASEKDLEWFKDARYGMMICYGLSTYNASDLSWSICKTRKAPDAGSGPFPKSEWSKWSEKMELENFDATEWIDIVKKTGMKYIVFIAKHHDGFHLWDTKYSDFKITNTPYGKDMLKEIADACHKSGIKFGIYYSQRDWYHPDYAPIDPAIIDVIDNAPYFKVKPGMKFRAGDSHSKYLEYQRNVVKELCTNYGKVDMFWFDASYWGGMFPAEMWDAENLTRMIRELQPGILINNRAGLPGDYDTPEQKLGMYQYPRPWETCMTLTHSWSWSEGGVPKSVNNILRVIITNATCNGNTLLSWGPKWDGRYDGEQIQRLEDVGNWLEKYGESIYETEGGPWLPGEWGGSTYKGKKAYLFISEKNKTTTLSAIDNKILKMTFMTGGDVKFDQSNSGVTVKLSNNSTVSKDGINVIEVTFKNKIKVISGNSVEEMSIFSDKMTYGDVISEKVNLTSATESNPSIVIELEKMRIVTGVSLDIEMKLEDQSVSTVEISKDGKNWKNAAIKKGKYSNWDAPITIFNAGIQIPGTECKYIKFGVETLDKAKIKINNISIYGE